MAVNPYIRTRHRLVRVGALLVEGPFSIRPPIDVDDYGWLECDLRLTQSTGGVVESAAVYVDDSMNREENFLEPVIRYVRWERAEDTQRALAGEITWPTATIVLSHFQDARAQVDQLIREVQALVAAVPFLVTGLVTDRRVLDATPDDRGEVEVYARNDVQRVEIATRAANDGGLHTAVVKGIAALRALLRPLVLDGWSESYREDVSAKELGGIRRWDYRPPSDGAPTA